jgi:hypothetical protein
VDQFPPAGLFQLTTNAGAEGGAIASVAAAAVETIHPAHSRRPSRQVRLFMSPSKIWMQTPQKYVTSGIRQSP